MSLYVNSLKAERRNKKSNFKISGIRSNIGKGCREFGLYTSPRRHKHYRPLHPSFSKRPSLVKWAAQTRRSNHFGKTHSPPIYLKYSKLQMDQTKLTQAHPQSYKHSNWSETLVHLSQVNGQDLSEMSHADAISFLRQCPLEVTLRLCREKSPTPISPSSPVESQKSIKAKPLRWE